MKKVLTLLLPALLFFTFQKASAHGTDQYKSLLVRKGIEKLQQYQWQNKRNHSQGKAQLNRYVVIVDDPDEDKEGYFRMVRNNGGDVISREQVDQLEEKLRLAAQSGIETYVLVINYLPVIVKNTKNVADISVEALFAQPLYVDPLSDPEAKKTAQEEYATTVQAIIGGIKREVTDQRRVYCSLGNTYALYQGKQLTDSQGKAIRRTWISKDKNEQVTDQWKELYGEHFAGFQSATAGRNNIYRAEKLVEMLVAVNQAYLGKQSALLSKYDGGSYSGVLSKLRTQTARNLLEQYKASLFEHQGPASDKQLVILQVIDLIEQETGNDQVFELYRQKIQEVSQWKSKITAFNYYNTQIKLGNLEGDYNLSDYEAFYRSYQAYLQIAKDQAQLFSSLSCSASGEALRQAAQSLSPEACVMLSLDSRQKLLCALSNTSLSGNWWSWVSENRQYGTEELAVSLIATVPATDKSDLIEWLESNEGKAVLHHLVSRVDGSNFTDFALALTNQVLEVKPVNQVFQLSQTLSKHQYLRFDGEFWSLVSNLEHFNDQHEINLLVIKYTLTGAKVQQIITAKAFDYVVCQFASDFQLTDQITFRAGQAVKLPAILCYLLFNQSNTNKIKTGLQLSVNAALLLVGIGEVKAAIQTANYARMILAAGDLGLAAADILMQGPFRARLERDHADFLKKWDLAVLLYGLGRLGYEGLDNLLTEAKDLKALERGGAAVFTTAEQGTLQRMIDKLEEMKGNGVPRVVNQLSADITSLQATATRLSSEVVAALTDLVVKQGDGIIDLIVHAEGNRYFAYVENTSGRLAQRIELTTTDLAGFIEQAGLNNTIPIRLLSCSSLESAQEFSRALGDRPLIATDGLVRVHDDGGITVVARSSGSSDLSWYELKNGSQTGTTHTPVAPAADLKDKSGKYIQMGEDLTSGGDLLSHFNSFRTKLSGKGFTALETRISLFDNDAIKAKFLDDFTDAQEDALQRLDADITIIDDWEITKKMVPVAGTGTPRPKIGNSQRYNVDGAGNPLTQDDWDLFYENESGDILANKGYMIEQSPDSRNRTDGLDPFKKPDFKLDNNNSLFFDCYSPRAGTRARSIYSTLINDKFLQKQQANRFVINLARWDGDINLLIKQFKHWPVKGVRQIIIIDKQKELINILQ